jgi:hypothetical protein
MMKAAMKSSLLIATLIFAAFVASSRAALMWSGLPYNVRELLSPHPWLSILALGGLLVMSGALPVAFALAWRRRARRFDVLLLPTVVVVTTLAFVALIAVAPVESLDDVLGTPVLHIGDGVERWLRFVGLASGPLVAATLGARLALGKVDHRMATGIVEIAALVGLSYLIVVTLADTDNIVELLRGYGSLASIIGVAGYCVLTGFVTTLSAKSVASRSKARIRGYTFAIAVVVLSVPLLWQCFVLAGNPRLDKYGRVFSARQFLLSPDRGHYLDDHAVAPRFAVIQLELLMLLAAGALVPMAVQGEEAQGSDAKR